MNEITVTTDDPVELTYKLRYKLEMSCAEIAEFLGVPPGTVMSRLSRARKRHGRQADYRPRSMEKRER